MAKVVVKYDYAEANKGNLLKQKDISRQPLIFFEKDIGKGPYTLIMVDLDAPDPARPIYSEWVHWMITNIPGNMINQGRIILPYEIPTPAKGTHRYVIYIYDQGGKELQPNMSYARQGFKRSVFLWQNGMSMSPAALNYFRVESLNK
jgi:hypothetical protein